ncbi:DUF6503 family protein [Negadavirga shengliensis]|uniref:DUF6503 family protein n=1 Tax=Negadavirga shengliensis TaxID=1389218 RepID=A0ABV9T7M4_9BACT
MFKIKYQKHRYLFILVTILLWECKGDDKAQDIVDKSIEAHWGGYPGRIGMEFEFRNIHYTLLKTQQEFRYTREFKDTVGIAIRDVLSNEGFQRYMDGKPVEVPQNRATAYSNSINSVMYFMLLPLLLNDDAVIKNYIGEVEVKGTPYYLVEISFRKKGGGKDYDDVYLYWFNKDTFLMDYLAYDFHVDGGGKRFREAINRREVNGVVIQDYRNYKADHVEDLFTLDGLFEDGKLEPLSEIENSVIDLVLK